MSADHPALAIFDVFKGQCTEHVFRMLEDNNILYVIVPSNCTDILQSLDLSINKSAKDFMKSKFQECGIIHKQLKDQIEEEVDMCLPVIKPLTVDWIIDFYHYMEAHPQISINGFHAAGIKNMHATSM